MVDDDRETGGGQTTESEVTDPVDTAPLGIGLYCIVAGLVALISIFFGIAAVADGQLPTGQGVLSVFFGTAQLGIIYGLLQLRTWGWQLGILWFCLHLLFSLAAGNPLGFALDFFMLFYLIAIKNHYIPD